MTSRLTEKNKTGYSAQYDKWSGDNTLDIINKCGKYEDIEDELVSWFKKEFFGIEIKHIDIEDDNLILKATVNGGEMRINKEVKLRLKK